MISISSSSFAFQGSFTCCFWKTFIISCTFVGPFWILSLIFDHSGRSQWSISDLFCRGKIDRFDKTGWKMNYFFSLLAHFYQGNAAEMLPIREGLINAACVFPTKSTFFTCFVQAIMKLYKKKNLMLLKKVVIVPVLF